MWGYSYREKESEKVGEMEDNRKKGGGINAHEDNGKR